MDLQISDLEEMKLTDLYKLAKNTRFLITGPLKERINLCNTPCTSGTKWFDVYAGRARDFT